jgi:hypothetical protein
MHSNLSVNGPIIFKAFSWLALKYYELSIGYIKDTRGQNNNNIELGEIDWIDTVASCFSLMQGQLGEYLSVIA